jgi:hypothetical protein
MGSTPPAAQPEHQRSAVEKIAASAELDGIDPGDLESLDCEPDVSEFVPRSFVVSGVDDDGIVRMVGWGMECPATGTTYMWLPGTSTTYKGNSSIGAARMMSRFGLTARLHECAPLRVEPIPVAELQPPQPRLLTGRDCPEIEA